MKDAMMEAWLMYAQPGKEHSRLAETVGTGTQENKLWQSPGAEPQVIPTVAEMKTIFGGRYLLQEMKGPMPGGAGEFEGLGIFGYDNFKNKHFFAWIDNTATTLMLGRRLRRVRHYHILQRDTRPHDRRHGPGQVRAVEGG
jgi:Protein of unknown function (DUF1579)